MNRIRTNIRKGLLTIAVAVVGLTPLASLATVSADTDTGCTVPASSTYGPGVRVPTGSDADAFVYQCPDPNNASKQYVGDWLSAHYLYNPTTQTTTPLSPVIYTYNSTSGKYDYSTWDYMTSKSSYVLTDHSVATPPANAVVVGGPAPVTSTASSNGTGSSSTASTPNSDSTSSATPNTNGSTGGGSNNTINGTTNNTTGLTNNNGATVGNAITSIATSGNAAVLSNTVGGSASTGNAITQANVINMLQSSSNALGTGANVATFTYTIGGDVNGDLLFDPSAIQNANGNSTIDNSLTNNLTINNTSNVTINNNLNLNSTSGDATVAENTQAGNATTGNASSIANIVNSIQSAVTAGKSFIGTINITGNLNGDILLPTNFVDQMLADNIPTQTVTAPDSTNTTTNKTTDTSTVTNTNNQGINNNVTSNAQSGNAAVSENTEAGTAKTGSAKTNVTAFNLTGSKVIASNDILVFVNVTGHWTGLILGAPAGATAAELGGNVTENSTATNTATLNNTNNQQINNNVNVAATSGNANVRDNTEAGDATSGDASTSVNLANIENSTLDLSNWFGILFINVLGTWNGSFGMDTSAGSTAAAAASSDPGTYYVGSTTRLVHYAAPSATTTAATRTTTPTNTTTTAPTTQNISDGTVLAAHTTTASKASPQLQTTTHRSYLLPALGLVVSLGILGSERLFNRRHA